MKKYFSAVELLIAICICLAGLYFTILGICHLNLSQIPGDLGDARFNMYILEHGYQYITGQVQSYWNAPFMYPFPNVIALSDNLLGTLPVYAFWRFVTFDRETSFQLWFIVICILNFSCALYALHKISGNLLLSAAGAYVFAFSIFVFTQFNHAQVFPRFITPLVIYWTIRYFDHFNIRYFLFMLMGIAYQFYCAMYLGFFISIVGGVLFLVLFFTHFHRARENGFFIPASLLKKFGCILLALTILLPIVIPYLQMYEITGRKTFADSYATVPVLSSYFFSSHVSWLWHVLSLHGVRDNFPWWDQPIFIGIIPWIAAAASAIFFFRRGFIAANKTLFAIVLTLLICILLTLKIGNFTLFKWIFMIPGFSSIGCVPRIINIYAGLFAFIIVLFANHLINKKKKIWYFILLTGVIADNLSVPERAFHFSKKDAQNRLLPLVAQLQQRNIIGKSAFAYIPANEDDMVRLQLDAMMASQVVHFPCVNGYTSTAAPGFGNFWYRHDLQSLDEWLYYSNFNRSAILVIH